MGTLVAEPPRVTRLGDGVYRVEHDGRSHVVYVAGPPRDQWAFMDGHVFRGDFGGSSSEPRRVARVTGPQALTAPMPATVIKVLVQPGAAVKKGDTILLLEAMKMELPIRAPADATVTAVHCREGELVQPETTLVELE
ncbi:MAG TPA: biotin/lipoyl-containing protein [Vicinamibacterales bacterium]|nr:biotin/lipoyl-containing protein [Vicinamibacterales bacterium]